MDLVGLVWNAFARISVVQSPEEFPSPNFPSVGLKKVFYSSLPFNLSSGKNVFFQVSCAKLLFKSCLCFCFNLLLLTLTSRLPPCTIATLSFHHSSHSIHHLLSRGLVLIGLNWGGWQCLPHVYGMPSVTRCGRTVRVSNTGQWRCHVGELIPGKTALRQSAPDPTTLGPLQGRQSQARTEALWDCLHPCQGFQGLSTYSSALH